MSTASRVWATGMRDPWKLTVDEPTGDIYMGEVTDGGPEEIDAMRADGPTFLNHGWPHSQDDIPKGHNPTPPANFEYEPAFMKLPHTKAGGDTLSFS